MAAKYEHNDDWVPWKFKRQRPDKVPGCQDTRLLPTLGEGQSSCEEGQQCYYFSCGKCSPSVALDVFNSLYKTDLEYIPRIPNIESPHPFKKDNKYYQYEGEMCELYFKYFAQIEELTGVAVNGWSNLDAHRIFHGVPETFQGTKFPQTKDFEIDWILFNGSTITVIEVKANTENSKSKKNFETKVKQLKKDQIVMRHLLEATGCEYVKVNYVIACPNVSIKEITGGKLLKDHQEFFQTITSLGCGLGFISQESISQKSLYLYDRKKTKLNEQPFLEFVKRSDVRNGYSVANQTSTLWGNAYKLAASSIVSSMLLLGSKAFDIENNLLTAHDGPDPTEVYTKRSVASSMERHEKKFPKIGGLLDELREQFPESLLLGPEQIEVIRCKSNRILIRGEPGTGKTSTLLALLFMHSAKVKHKLQSPNFKKVLFVLRESKTEFRKYVEAFIDNHCNKAYAEVMPVSDEYSQFSVDSEVKVVLFDECPLIGFNSGFQDRIEKLPEEVKLVCAITYYTVSDSKLLESPLPRWKTFYLVNAYRCPTNIALRYTKLRRQNIHKNKAQQFFLPFSKSAPHFIDEKNAVKIMRFKEYILEYKLPQKQFEGESLLLVIINYNDVKNVDTKFAENFDYSFTYTATSKHKNPFVFEGLDFTGVQYHTVVIIIFPMGYEKRCETIEILYHAVSRSLRRLIILCQEYVYNWITSILSLDNLDLSVFMKLKRGEHLSDQDMSLLKEVEDLNEALEILIIRKDYTQLNSLVKNILGSKVDYFIESVMERWLAQRMLNLEEHDLLNLLTSALQPDGNFLFFLYFFMDSAVKYYKDPFCISKMRKIFVTLQSQYHTKWNDFISQQPEGKDLSTILKLLNSSVVWFDSKTFSVALMVFKTAIQNITDILLEISVETPNHLQCYLQPYYKKDAWANFDIEMQACFNKYSSLKKDGKLKYYIGKSVITQVCTAAANLFNCSTCRLIMELVAPQNELPFFMECKLYITTRILNVLKFEERWGNKQTANRDALEYLANKLGKQRKLIQTQHNCEACCQADFCTESDDLTAPAVIVPGSLKYLYLFTERIFSHEFDDYLL